MSVPINEWEWFGNAGHFICSNRCRFHLCTKVGKYLVSTVGELFVKENDLKASIVALDALYETMVFKAGKPCPCGCGLPSIKGNELGVAHYKSPGAATLGHLEACQEWSRLKENAK